MHIKELDLEEEKSVSIQQMISNKLSKK